MGYMLGAGAAVTQPDGERYMHTLQPPPVDAPQEEVTK